MPTTEQLAGHGAVAGRRINAEGDDRAVHSGGETSGTRWMDTALDMVDVTGMRVANGPRDPHTIIDPSRVVTINGRQYTPRINIHGSFSREGLWGNVNKPTAMIAALALGGVGAEYAGLTGTGEGGGLLGTTGGLDPETIALATGGSGSTPATAGLGLTGGLDPETIALATGNGPSASAGLGITGGLDPETIAIATGNAPEAGAGTGAFDIGGSTGFGGSTPIDSPWLADMGETGAFDIGGSTGFGGTTPLDTPWWQYITDPIANMIDNPMQYLDALAGMKGQLPGIASALGGAGQQPGGTRPNSSIPSPGGAGGLGGRAVGKVDLLENPYTKAKISQPGNLLSYLRG